MSHFFFLFFLFFFLSSGELAKGRKTSIHQLSADFYAKTCPQVENLIGAVTSQRHKTLPASGAATIRLFFHDCFIRGCDGSILLDVGSEGKGVAVEREMYENRNLPAEGFDTVQSAKAAVEKFCPNTVSCADILAIAARDFVHLAGGPYYTVMKGRKDGKSSSSSLPPPAAPLSTIVRVNLPRSNSTVTELITLFASKGLSVTDMVALSGAHTIGFAHCEEFAFRLYSGWGKGMDERLVEALRVECPQRGESGGAVAPLDVATPMEFDNEYYGGIGKGMGLLETDQGLGLDERTKGIVKEMGGDKGKFFMAFGEGMERMGRIRIKKGKKGEIRRVCGRHLD